MLMQDIAAAIKRVKAVLARRPDVGIHDDSPAVARWERGVRVVSSHANGTRMETDMPAELGGTGDRVTPGWLFRAGVASCAATSIALRAADEGIDLTALEVSVTSRSDTRGILGMRDESGKVVSAGPGNFQLNVRIAANGVAPERLRALVETAERCSPIPSAVRDAVPIALKIDVEAA